MIEQLGLVVKPDDGALPVLATFHGEDATGFAFRTGTDPKRLVAIDATGDTSKRLTLMQAPSANRACLDAVVAAVMAKGIAATVIADSPGFVLQRMRAMIANLGCEMAQIGLATPQDIDTAMKLGLNYPMGPLEIVEDLGAERTFTILQEIQAATGDPRYRPSLWLRRRALLGMGTHSAG